MADMKIINQKGTEQNDNELRNALNETSMTKPVDNSELVDSSVSKVSGGSLSGFYGKEHGIEYGTEYGNEYGIEHEFEFEEPYTSTKMVCQKCGYSVWWRGDRVGKSDDCSRCGGKGTLLGVELQRG